MADNQGERDVKIIGKINGARGVVKAIKIERGSRAYAVIAWENPQKGQQGITMPYIDHLLHLERHGSIAII